MIKKYRKNPVVVEALQWSGNDIEAASFLNISIAKLRKLRTPGYMKGLEGKGELIIKTKEGDLEVKFGGFIVKGGQGEYWPVDEKIFPTLYNSI